MSFTGTKKKKKNVKGNRKFKSKKIKSLKDKLDHGKLPVLMQMMLPKIKMKIVLIVVQVKLKLLKVLLHQQQQILPVSQVKQLHMFLQDLEIVN